MFKTYKKGIYKGIQVEIRREDPNGNLIIITLDHGFAKADGGWVRVDKFEWDKTVSRDEVVILPEESS